MVIVSACLAGVECRYNGQAFSAPKVIQMVKRGQAIPLCPEILGSLPTPRPAAEQCNGRIISMDGQDFTYEYTAGAVIALNIAKLVGCKKAILKSKSPTCGSGTIYDGTFSGKLVKGEGLFCKLLREENVEVMSEDELE